MVCAEEKIEQARRWIRNSIRNGHLAHAYLLGGPAEVTEDFAEFVLRQLMCDGDGGGEDGCPRCRQIDSHAHPDALWVEPTSKSRLITIDETRILSKRIGETSFYGGWKAGVIVDADRLNPASANCFLKTLEEPPDRSILLLLSEKPDELLPTIRSRCQYINLFTGTTPAKEPWADELLDILRAGHQSDPLHVLQMSGELQSILDRERKAAEDETPPPPEGATKDEKDRYAARVMSRVLNLRHKIIRQILLWHRDVLMVVVGADESTLHFPEELEVLKEQAAGLDYAAAAKILAENESMGHRLERQVPDRLIFDDSLINQAAIAFRTRKFQARGDESCQTAQSQNGREQKQY